MKTVREMITRLYSEHLPESVIVQQTLNVATPEDKDNAFVQWVTREVRQLRRAENKTARDRRFDPIPPSPTNDTVIGTSGSGTVPRSTWSKIPSVVQARPLSQQPFVKHNGQEVNWTDVTLKDLEDQIAWLRSQQDKLGNYIVFLSSILERMIEAGVERAGDWDGLQSFLDHQPEEPATA